MPAAAHDPAKREPAVCGTGPAQAFGARRCLDEAPGQMCREAVITVERALDEVCAQGAASEAAATGTEAAAFARGGLQLAQLRVHLATRDVMTPARRAAYAATRRADKREG